MPAKRIPHALRVFKSATSILHKHSARSFAAMATAAVSNASSSFHSTHSNTYERMASNCTKSIALKIIPLLSPITSSSYVLDNSCGPGLVTTLLKILHPTLRIQGADLAPGMITIYNDNVVANSWSSTVTSSVCDCRALEGFEDGAFSHVITNFGFVPDLEDIQGPGTAAREMWRVLREDGMAVMSIWKERNFTSAIEATARRIRPDVEPFTWKMPEDWSQGPWLQKTMADAGFGENVVVEQVDGGMSAASLDELVDNMMCGKDMFFKDYTEEEMGRVPGIMKEELRALDAFYEDCESGEVGVKMEAWVAFATK